MNLPKIKPMFSQLPYPTKEQWGLNQLVTEDDITEEDYQRIKEDFGTDFMFIANWKKLVAACWNRRYE